MGQAKQRGSFEQRYEMAIARNAELDKIRLSNDSHPLRLMLRKFGSQRTATLLAAVGAISLPSARLTFSTPRVATDEKTELSSQREQETPETNSSL